MKKKKILFILSRILGGKTFSNSVVEAVKEIPNIDPGFLFFDDEDYGKYKKPNFYKRFNAAMNARAKFNSIYNDINSFDAIFIQSFGLILGFKDIILKKPAILACDGTNILGHWLVYNQNRGIFNQCKFMMKSIMTTTAYWKTIRNINVFLPRTNWCASSLKNHYRINPDKIIVAPGAIDLNLWKSQHQKCNEKKPNLLFVGNDFERKGGALLLEIYSKFLINKASITIVSNDKRLSSRSLPDGVKLIQNITHESINKLINIYNSADIFIFPTTKDQLGLVLLEAAAMGLPIVASDVGGISDIVKDDINGYIIPYLYVSSVEKWGKTIIDLVKDKDKRNKFGRKSRELAKFEFSKNEFKLRISRAFEML